MKKLSKKEAGFSLIELLLVVAMIGVLASIAAAAMMDAKVSAGKSAAVAHLKSIYSAQQGYHIQNSRYANITELAAAQTGFGTVTANTLSNGRYTYQMSPLVPTATQLADTFSMEANGVDNGQTIKFTTSQRGNITQVLPMVRNW